MKQEEHKEYIQEQSENIAYINLSVQLESTKRGITSIQGRSLSEITGNSYQTNLTWIHFMQMAHRPKSWQNIN